MIETRDKHPWAAITRLTLTQVFDPEYMLEATEVSEDREEMIEDQIHIIPKYNKDIEQLQVNLEPLSA